MVKYITDKDTFQTEFDGAYCDKCGECVDYDPVTDTFDLYEVEDEQLCADCALKYFDRVRSREGDDYYDED